jgi:outer membrane protein assembly factor BamD (BamD/ComL family)
MRIKPLLLAILLVNFFTVSSQTNDTIVTEKQYFINAHTLAANEFNDSLLKQYIFLYPEGEYRDKALANIDIIAWQLARHKNTEESYQNYLNEFPNGKAVKLAQQKLDLINSTKKTDKE